MNLEAFGSSYYRGKKFFGVDVFHNVFVYQSTFNIFESKKDKDKEYVIGSKSKGLFESNLLPWRFLT